MPDPGDAVTLPKSPAYIRYIPEHLMPRPSHPHEPGWADREKPPPEERLPGEPVERKPPPSEMPPPKDAPLDP